MSSPTNIQSHPHASMTSEEVDYIILSHLIESGYTHTSFSLLHESSLSLPTPPGVSTSTSPQQPNGVGKPATTPSDSIFQHAIPPGHLVRILHKGLLYLEAEARYRGDPAKPSPRLVGYPIPNALPLPPLPKQKVPVSTLASPSNPVTFTSTATNGASDKGKGKAESTSTGKRKARAGSDKDDQTDGKRVRVNEASEKKGGKGTAVASTSIIASKGVSQKEDSPMDESPITNSPIVSNHTSSIRPPPIPTTTTIKVPPLNQSKSFTATTTSKKSTSPASFRPSASASSSNLSSRAGPSTSVSTSVSAPSINTLATSSNKKKSASPSLGPTAAQIESKKRDESKKVAETVVAVPISMVGVKEIGIEDVAVLRLRGHTVPKVQPCSWNPKVPALLATGGGDSTCRIWDVPEKLSMRSSTAASSLGIGAEGLIVKDNIILKHSSGAQRKADVAAVAWDPTGSLLATGSEDGIARIWTPSGDLHLVLSMHQRTIFSLKWNSVGTMLLTASLDSSVCLWELSNGKVKQQWQTHTDSVLDVDWNDDSTFASASMDRSIHLFSISRLSPVHRFKGHRDEVNVVKFSPCGTLLASCSDDHTVRIWSLNNIPGLNLSNRAMSSEQGRLIDEEEEGGGGVFVLEGHTHDVHTIAWAPWTRGSKGPRLVASASFDSTARLWSAEDGSCLHTFARHTDYVYSLSFSPGLGEFLATGSNDSKMCVWSVKDYKLLMEYTHSGPIYEIAFQKSRISVCGRTEDVAIVSFAHKDKEVVTTSSGGSVVGINGNSSSSSSSGALVVTK